MPRVVWTPPALRDLVRLYGFLAAKNPNAARRAIRTIRRGVRTLAAHPEIGPPAAEVPPEYREWLIRFGDSFYLTLYRYAGELVAILAVRHAREAGYLDPSW